MSLYLNITFKFLFLLCFIWKSVEHNQHLFSLAHSFLFTLTLTLFTLFNFLYFCSFRFESLKGYINSGLTQCIKKLCFVLKFYQRGCVARANTVCIKKLCFVLKFYQKGCVARANTVLHVISKKIRLI